MSDVVTVRATTKHVGLSAQKVRLVVDQVRGRRATEALAFLAVMPQAEKKRKGDRKKQRVVKTKRKK